MLLHFISHSKCPASFIFSRSSRGPSFVSNRMAPLARYWFFTWNPYFSQLIPVCLPKISPPQSPFVCLKFYVSEWKICHIINVFPLSYTGNKRLGGALMKKDFLRSFSFFPSSLQAVRPGRKQTLTLTPLHGNISLLCRKWLLNTQLHADVPEKIRNYGFAWWVFFVFPSRFEADADFDGKYTCKTP